MMTKRRITTLIILLAILIGAIVYFVTRHSGEEEQSRSAPAPTLEQQHPEADTESPSDEPPEEDHDHDHGDGHDDDGGRPLASPPEGVDLDTWGYRVADATRVAEAFMYYSATVHKGDYYELPSAIEGYTTPEFARENAQSRTEKMLREWDRDDTTCYVVSFPHDAYVRDDETKTADSFHLIMPTLVACTTKYMDGESQDTVIARARKPQLGDPSVMRTEFTFVTATDGRWVISHTEIPTEE